MTFAISKNFYKKRKNDNYVYDHRNKKIKLDLRLLNTRILVYEDMVKTWFFQVAKYLSIKNKVKFTSEQKKMFCKHCHVFLVQGKNCRVRIHKHRLIYFCQQCRSFMRFPVH